LNISGGQIIANTARTSYNTGNAYGGAIYAGSGATVNISGGVIDGNSATVGAAGLSAVAGGGVYIASGATVEVTGGTLTGNTVTVADVEQKGGGAYVHGGTLIISPQAGTTLNWVDNIELRSASDNVKIGADLSSMTGTLNISTGYEPAGNDVVATSYGAYKIQPSDINKMLFADLAYYIKYSGADNTAVLDKGGVYVSYNASGGGSGTPTNPYGKLSDALASAKVIILQSPTYPLAATELDLLSTQYNSTRIVRDPGNTGDMFSVSTSGTTTISGVTLDGNRTQATSSTGSIVNISNRAILSLGNGAVLQNNRATNGGGVYVTGGGTLTVAGGAITGNAATSTSTGEGGGGVYITSLSTLNLNSGTIGGNTAHYGGGVLSTSSTLHLAGGTIFGNSADNSGGGVYFTSPPTAVNPNFTISGAQINNNTSELLGGGIYATSSSVRITMTAGAINGNIGGGVYMSDLSGTGGTFAMSGGLISSNVTKNAGSGAGVYVGYNGTFTLSGGSIVGNIADGDGGGIYFTATTLNLTGGSIEANFAQGNAGGVFTSATNTTIDGTVIRDNTATGYGTEYSGNGGGLYVAGSGSTSVSFSSGSITGNIAKGKGGGIYQQSSNITQSGGSITNNKADIGGGVYQYYIGYNLTGGTISGNTASSYANGFYIDGGNQLTLAPTNGSLSFGTNDDIYLPSGATFAITARLDTGLAANTVLPLSFANPQTGATVATTPSAAIANQSRAKLVSGSIAFGVSGTNIVIAGLRS
jgi:hypothetical protein